MGGVVRTLTTNLVISGEAELKQKLSAINSEYKTLASAVKVAESSFAGQANSVAALTAKDKALNDVKTKQVEKINKLKEALANAQSAQQTYNTRAAEAKTKLDTVTQSITSLDAKTQAAGTKWANYSTQVTKAETQLAKYRSQGTLTAETESKLNEKIESAKTKMAALETETNGAAKTAGQMVLEQNNLNKALSEAQSHEAAAAKGVNDWQQKLNTATVELNRLDGEIKTNNKYLAEAEKSSDGCASSIDKFGKETKGTSEAVGTLASALAAAGIAATVKEIAEALLECADAAESFEYGVAKIQTVANVSEESLSGMSAAILALSNETGVATTDLNEAVYQAISAGVDAASAVEFTASAIKLAEGGFTSATTSVDVLTTAINAYGLSAADATAISDMLITTQNLGKTTVDQLASKLGEVIPIASGLGVNIENLSTAFAVLTKNGVKTELAGTYIRAMLNSLADSSSEVSKTLVNETGKSFAELTEDGYSLGDVLGILYDSVDQDGTAFNNLWGEIRAGTGALSIVGSGVENFNTVLAAMQNSAGATEKAFATMEDTAEHAQKVFQTAAANLKTAIGSQLTPALTKLRTAGANAFEWAADFVENNPWLVSAITTLLTVFATLVTAIAAVTAVTQIIIPVIAAFNAVLAANPAVLVATAVAALIVALTTLALTLPDAGDEASELAKDFKEMKESADKATEAFVDTQTAINEQATATQYLISTIETLSAKEKKTAADKAALKSAIDQLNASVDGLNLSYDETTDTLYDMSTGAKTTTESLKLMAQAQAAAQRQQANADRLVALYSQRAGYVDELTENELKLAEAEALVASGGGEVVQVLGAGWVNTAVLDVYTLKETIDGLNTSISDTDQQIDELSGSMVDEAEESIDAVDSALSDMTDSIDKLNEKWVENKNAATSALESTTSGWEAMDNTAKKSAEDTEAILESKTEWLNSYNANLNALANREIPGVDTSALIASLSDGSTQSAAVLAGLAEASDEEVAKVADSFDQVKTATDNASTTIANLETDYNTQMEQIVSDTAEMVKDIDQSSEAYTSGANTIRGYINGINSESEALNAKLSTIANSAIATWQEAWDEHSPSRVMKKSGINALRGNIQGVEAAQAELNNSYAMSSAQAQESFNGATPTISLESVTRSTQTINHTGTIRVEGVNSEGELVGAYDIIIDQLRQEARM